MKKIYILQELIPNYRVPVFNKISKLKNMDLTVFYNKPSKVQNIEGLKNSNKLEGFKSVCLPSFEIGKFNFQFFFLKHLIIEKPDIVIAGKGLTWDNLLFLIYCKLFKIRWIWWFGGVPYIDRKRIKKYSTSGKMNKLFGKYNPVRLLGFQADGMITYSDHAKNYFENLGFKKRILVAPNSPDTDQLLQYKQSIDENKKLQKRLKAKFAPNGEKIIFTLGRLNKVRKIDQLLEVFSRIQGKNPLTTLIIVGDGYERAKLEKIVQQKNLKKVYFLGSIYDDETLSQYFYICDLYVTPGAASMTLKMAMCFGKPVVSTAHGLEVHAIEKNENGFITDIDDITGLHKKISFLLNNDEFRLKMGAKAYKTIIEKININEMVKTFKNVLENN